MTKIERLVALVISSNMARESYQAARAEEARGFAPDECPCCVDSQIDCMVSWWEHELQGEINAAILMASPCREVHDMSLIELMDVAEGWLAA